MTQAGILRLGTLIDKPAAATGAAFGFTLPPTQLLTPVAARMPDGSQMVANSNVATTAAGSGKVASPEAAHAAGLFWQEKSRPRLSPRCVEVPVYMPAPAEAATTPQVYEVTSAPPPAPPEAPAAGSSGSGKMQAPAIKPIATDGGDFAARWCAAAAEAGHVRCTP